MIFLRTNGVREKERVRFENICFKVILFYAGNLNIYVGNLRTVIGAKLCHASFRV